MSLKRGHAEMEVDGGPKRQKMGANSDPKSNPYLAHMYSTSDSDEDGGVSLAQPTKPAMKSSYETYQRNSDTSGGGLTDFHRHRTSSKQAKAAEDGPTNPFTGQGLSNSYFNILRTRRNLPVHAQRYVR